MSTTAIARSLRAKLTVLFMTIPGLWLAYLATIASTSLHIHLWAAGIYYLVGAAIGWLAQRQATKRWLQVTFAALFGFIWIIHMVAVLIFNWRRHLRELTILQTIRKDA